MTDLDLEKWTVESNDAIRISLQPSYARSKAITFAPAFTYAIFGKENEEDEQKQPDEEAAQGNGETIFGYQDLKIRLDFAADTMRPILKVTWAEKLEPIGDDIHADEPEEVLREFMPCK